jgi:hypothetical protein
MAGGAAEMTAPGTARTAFPSNRARTAAGLNRRMVDTTTAGRRPSTRLDLRMPAVVALCAAGYAVSLAAVVNLQAIRDPAFTDTFVSQPGPASVAAAAPPLQAVGSDTPTSTEVLANDITALESQAQSVAAQAGALAGPGSLGNSQFSLGAPRTHGSTGASGQN